MKLEQLFNSLIEKGWKPFGREKTLHISIHNWDLMSVYLDWWFMNEDTKSLRELVSKESGLWQFVCNNWLIPEDRKCHERVLDLTFWPNWPDVSAQMCSRNYEYWLMSSAICDEKYLEQFLIENIKI